MGLLDDLLAGLGEQGRAGQSMGQPQAAPAGGGSMNQILAALLPVVLGMLANRGASGSQVAAGQRPASPAGGLDDLLGSIFGGSRTSGMGGLGELLSQLQRAGYGQQADSWVSRGQNMPLPADALEQVFGRGGLEEIARRAGVSEADANRGLSQLLPEVVDRVTPEGRVPDLDSLAASVDAMARRSRR
jgi:uncharacterized protein YidB (DUF937 family)